MLLRLRLTASSVGAGVVMALIYVQDEFGKRTQVTADNTVIHLFIGNSDLDHVATHVVVDEAISASYDRSVIVACMRYGVPVTLYPNRPDWAIERYMQAHPDALLDIPT